MINKNIVNMMLAVMMTVGLGGCSQDDNPVNSDFSSAVLGQWYSEDNAPGSFDAHGIAIDYQKSVIYASFDEAGSGFWSIIFVDEYGDAIDIPGYFCGGGLTYSFKNANTVHVKMTSSGIPVMNDEWDVTVTDKSIYVPETGKSLSHLTEEDYPVVQRWLRELGLGNAEDQDESVPHLSLDKREIIIYNGETDILTATIFPADTKDKDVVWSSNYTRVATVDNNGVVTAQRPGTAIITAKSKADNTLYDRCRVMVVLPDVTGISLNKTSMDMGIGATEQLIATIEPFYAKNKNFTWSSNNPDVASVDENGLVTPLTKGKTTITATTEDGGFKAQCDVTVKALLAIWKAGSELTVTFQYGRDVFGRDKICKLTGKYDGQSFKHSFSGNITEANTNVYMRREGIYFTVHMGRTFGLAWDKSGMSWTFNPDDDTYIYGCGENPGSSPETYKLISVTINGIDITNQLTRI